MKTRVGDNSQKNLEVNLSSTQEEIADWLDHLSEENLDQIEWLIEEIDYLIESMQLAQTGYAEAKQVISRFTSKL